MTELCGKRKIAALIADFNDDMATVTADSLQKRPKTDSQTRPPTEIDSTGSVWEDSDGFIRSTRRRRRRKATTEPRPSNPAKYNPDASITLGSTPNPTAHSATANVFHYTQPTKTVRVNEKWNGKTNCGGGFPIWRKQFLEKLSIAGIPTTDPAALNSLRENVTADMQSQLTMNVITGAPVISLADGLDALNDRFMNMFVNSNLSSVIDQRLARLSLANHDDISEYVGDAHAITCE